MSTYKYDCANKDKSYSITIFVGEGGKQEMLQKQEHTSKLSNDIFA